MLQLSNNLVINLRTDKPSELYRYVDKKLNFVGRERMRLASVVQTKLLAEGQMHLLKSEGDSTIQGFESSFSFKEDGRMVLPEESLIQSMNWLKSDSGIKLLLSGTNMPVTVLTLESSRENGIQNYKIVLDAAMTELIADNSDILAFRANNDASIIVTEEQILVVRSNGRVIKTNC